MSAELPAAAPEGDRRRRRAIVPVVAALVVGLLGGFLIGHFSSASRSVSGPDRDFMFQLNGVHSPNQSGHTVNLIVHYRYPTGIAEEDLPNYLHLRKVALAHLVEGDFTGDPYWETVNMKLCEELKEKFAVSAISCQLQLPGVTTPGVRYQPGWHSSVHTIGDIDPLSVPGPVTVTPTPAQP